MDKVIRLLFWLDFSALEWLGLKFELDRKWQTVVIRFPEKTEATKATLTIE